MSLETRIRDLALRIATEFNTVEGQIGVLTNLATTDKSNLVNAINEVLTSAGVTIDDNNSTLTTTYSSSKIDAEIAQAVSDLVDTAPTALDTLAELAVALQDNDSDIASITTALSQRVRFDIDNQGLTIGQQQNARTNTGSASQADLSNLTANVGNTDRDFVADFEGGLS